MMKIPQRLKSSRHKQTLKVWGIVGVHLLEFFSSTTLLFPHDEKALQAQPLNTNANLKDSMQIWKQCKLLFLT